MVSAKSSFMLIIFVLLCSMLLYLAGNKYFLGNAHLLQVHESTLPCLEAEVGHQIAAKYKLSRPQNRSYEDCHGHVQLCWLRDVLSVGYNQTFPKDIYDLSTLYKFKTHMFLDYPDFFGARMNPYVGGPELRKRGQDILKIMELEQLLTGNKLKLLGFPQLRKCDYNPDKEYHYMFNAYQQNNSINVFVNEILLATNERGRMNDIFGVITTDKTVSACELVDYFSNHTYHIVCPLLEKNFEISIKAMYHSISPCLFGCSKSNLKQLKLYTNNDFNHNLIPGILLKNSAEVKCNNSKGHHKGFWLKDVLGVPQSVFHWSTATCHYSFIISNSSLKCLRRKKVIMFGDSHMNRRQQSIESTYKLANFEFYVSTSHSMHLLRNLLLTYEAFLNGSKYADVLVVNVGAHDFVELDIITYIATMSDIFTMFKRFLDLPKPPKIIWLEIYPTPFIGRNFRYMKKLVIESTNDWVNHNMEKLGIEVVHSFDIAITMANHDKDNIHYWDSFGPNMIPPEGKTSVGGAVISVLFSMICPDTYSE